MYLSRSLRPEVYGMGGGSRSPQDLETAVAGQRPCVGLAWALFGIFGKP